MTRVYLSLGSNIGDRRDYLNRAITALSKLPRTQLIEVSSLYETPAWGLTDQDDFFKVVDIQCVKIKKIDFVVKVG